MAEPLTDWNTGLFDCCDDECSCCYGFFCCPCLACTVSGNFGENSCLPICDMCSPAITAAFGIPLCVPPAALALRVGIRHKYGIKGSLCKDIATSCFCEWCSYCQMHRELKYRKQNNTVIVNMQSAPVMMAPAQMMMAPAPVMMAPAPVMMAPAPVMMAPAPVMMAPAPVMMAPAPVMMAPAPVMMAPAPVMMAPAQMMVVN